MAITIKGTGIVTTNDFRNVTWTGKTKSGKSVVITINNAINMGNIDWSMAEKDDVVPQIELTGTYGNTNYMVSSASDYEEPWSISYAGSASDPAADQIILGAGVFAIGGTNVALTRGGGQFTVEREFRNINADGDRGPVKDRVVMDASTCKLTLNALTFLTSMPTVYAAISTTT